MTKRFDIQKEKHGRVEAIANWMRHKITSERLPAHTPILSVRSLATQHKVSPLTACRALNLLAQDNIIYRIQGKGTFVAEHKNWLNNRVTRIGLSFYASPASYLSDSYHTAFGKYHSRIIDMLKHEGHELSIISGAEKEELNIFQKTINHTDALIINKDWVNDQNLKLLLAYPNPIILIDSTYIKDLPFHQVVPDYFLGYKKIIEYIRSLNCTSVACAGVSDTETHNFRRNYFTKMLKRFAGDITLYDDLIIPLKEHDMGRLTGRELGKMYLSRNPRPNVIFSVSDFISFGILDVLLEKKLIPGKDFKLISFDNIEKHEECPFGKPMLTTLTNPRAQETEETIKLLKETMASNDKNIRIIKVPANEFIIRKTT